MIQFASLELLRDTPKTFFVCKLFSRWHHLSVPNGKLNELVCQCFTDFELIQEPVATGFKFRLILLLLATPLRFSPFGAFCLCTH